MPNRAIISLSNPDIRVKISKKKQNTANLINLCSFFLHITNAAIQKKLYTKGLIYQILVIIGTNQALPDSFQ